METNRPTTWVRQAQRRASTRTFVVPTDSRGRAILSFWLSRAERPAEQELEAEAEA